MPDLLLELFSEEIPARMQQRGAEDLERLMTQALAPLLPREPRQYSGPRRIALALTLDAAVAPSRSSERGPRVAAPEQALAGFLRKHAAARDDLRAEGDFWILDRVVPGIDAAGLIARETPGVLRRFPWPKSMRWGTSRFLWVRPLRRILCVLDGAVVPFDVRDGDDDAHGLASGDLTEGHRFMAPGAFAARSEGDWKDGLVARCVRALMSDRRKAVEDAVRQLAHDVSCEAVDDDALLDEVAGLVEWPVCLRGRIGAEFMELPAEVMQVSMRVNQRYFAMRHPDGTAAPYFAFAANIQADDGGAAIIAGNERVLRARFSDARHFYDMDRTRTLASRVDDLKSVTFHAKLGTQYDRANRLARIAGEIAKLVGADPAQAARAALLCKADLTTGMVGEFPELQGVMGGYYARHDGEPDAVCAAIGTHYAPRGVDDEVARGPVAIAVSLADKLDQLVQFFAAGEKPTGSGDPFALRRAALGALRTLDGNRLNLRLSDLVALAGAADPIELRDFLKDRLAIMWRAGGQRIDIIRAVFGDAEDRIDDLGKRAGALAAMLETEDGRNLLAAYHRAVGILEGGSDPGQIDPVLFDDESERALNAMVTGGFAQGVGDVVDGRSYETAIRSLAELRAPLDAFFERVRVNVPEQPIRDNRLRLLSRTVALMNRVADLKQIQR